MTKEKELSTQSIPSGKVDKEKITRFVLDDFTRLDSDRQGWVNKRKLWIKHWDDFITPHIKPVFDGGSTFHIPLTFSQAKAIKAKLLRGIFQLNPPFYVRPQEVVDEQQVALIENMMRYAVDRYCNRNQGLFKEIGDWLWDCITEGFGITKLSWERVTRKYKDIEETEVTEQLSIPGPDGTPIFQPVKRTVSQEIDKEEVIFDGPVLQTVSPDDFFMPKSAHSLDEADKLVHRLWMSESELRQAAKSGFFDAKAVKHVVEKERNSEDGDDPSGSKYYGNDTTRDIEAIKDELEGVRSVDAYSNKPKHEILEWYGSYDIDKDGIDEEVVFWVHRSTQTLLRWTYLDRITKSSQRPFFKIDFLPRPRSLYAMGLVEMNYPLNAEMDAMHNMRLDAGKFLIPFGLYRAASGIKSDDIRIEPGKLIPVDDVKNDINFVQMPNSSVIWGFQEEEALLRYSERLVAISDIQLGRPSETQSQLRTATGTVNTIEEANIQIDALLRHVYDGWSKVLKGLFQLLQQNIPLGLVIRVTGELGQNVFSQINSREDIKGNYDFEVRANTSMLNKEISRQNKMQAFQLALNPVMLQLGIVSPHNIYNMLVDLLKAFDILDIGKYVTEPPEVPKSLNPFEALNMIAQGQNPPVQLHDDHQAHIDTALEYEKENENFQALLLDPKVKAALDMYLQQHNQMMAIIEAQAQQQNVTGLQISPNLAGSVVASLGGNASQMRESGQFQNGASNAIPGNSSR